MRNNKANSNTMINTVESAKAYRPLVAECSKTTSSSSCTIVDKTTYKKEKEKLNDAPAFVASLHQFG